MQRSPRSTPTTSPPPSRRSTPSRSTSTSGSRNCRHHRADRPFLVAVDDKRIVGYAYLGGYNPKPAYRQTSEDTIYVAPGWEQRGVGNALMSALLEASAATDVREIVALIAPARRRVDRTAPPPRFRRSRGVAPGRIQIRTMDRRGDLAVQRHAVGSLGAGLGSVGGISSSVDALRVV